MCRYISRPKQTTTNLLVTIPPRSNGRKILYYNYELEVDKSLNNKTNKFVVPFGNKETMNIRVQAHNEIGDSAFSNNYLGKTK